VPFGEPRGRTGRRPGGKQPPDRGGQNIESLLTSGRPPDPRRWSRWQQAM